MDEFVLVIDDEAHIRRILTLQLEKFGFQVKAAADGKEALDLLRESLPMMVITDYQMPHLDGLELCAILGQQPETRRLPVLLLTARGHELDEAMLRTHVNLVGVLSKPFSPSELLEIVRQAIGAREDE